MILLLSNKWDLTVDFVVLELRRRNWPFIRLNTEDLIHGALNVSVDPLRIRMSGAVTWDSTSTELKAIWNRRPGKPFEDRPASERPSRATLRFVTNQWYAALEALQLLPGITWINHPRANDAMEIKLRQLPAARALGFRIPETLVTNDRQEVRAWMSPDASYICKALYAPLIEEEDADKFIFTNLVTPDDIDADALKVAPVIFQRALLPKHDYRVTVVGDRVFCARVAQRAPADSVIDWRTLKKDIEFVPCELPDDLQQRCVELVRQSGLRFGAIDLIEHEGDYYFIEINPNGEWGWLQKPVGLPIAEALCDLLIAADKQ